MRLPLIAIVIAATAGPLSAQAPRAAGIIHTGRSSGTPVTQPAPQPTYDDYYYRREPYRILEPRMTMDSVVRIVERKYTGWFVRAKQLVSECQGPVYIFDMIAAGDVGEHRLRVDGDTGEVLNPEVIGQHPDSVLVPNCGYHRERNRSSTGQ